MLKEVTLNDIEPIAIGAGILGTGGGGSPYQGSLHLRQVIRQLGPQKVIQPEDLADEARVVVVGFIGAPTASIEKIHEGSELQRAIRLLEDHLEYRFDAIGIAEIGGSNSIGPLVAGLQTGLPTIDADGMGRAFPEVQMATFLWHGDVSVAPFAMADAGDNYVIVPKTMADIYSERIARNVATSMGATAGLAGMVMNGKQFRNYCVPYTLSLAHQLGKHVLQAQQEGSEDIPGLIASFLQGHNLFRGKITDVNRRITQGFARGTLKLESFNSPNKLYIEFQNEFLIAYLNGEVKAIVPDMICIVDDETGEPISTELLRYGMRVSVLAVPGADALKTPYALNVVGPKAFGYEDVVFRPLAGGVIGKRLESIR